MDDDSDDVLLDEFPRDHPSLTQLKSTETNKIQSANLTTSVILKEFEK